MIHGKYVGLIMDFTNPLELKTKVRKGYLKMAWKQGSGIRTGYLIIKEGKIFGSIVEDVLKNELTKGDQAFKEILDAIKNDLIRAVEVYEANVDEILSDDKAVMLTSSSSNPIQGHDLDALLSLLKTHRGSMKIQNGSKEWAVYVEKGLVTAAKALRGSTHRGDMAVKEILYEMGHLIKGGKYIPSNSFDFSSKDAVTNKDIFVEGVNLLKEKRKFEKGF